MTAKEALYLVKVQLSKTDQNKEVIQVLEGLVNLPARHIDDENKTLDDLFREHEYMKLYDEKTGRKCANYELAEDEILLRNRTLLLRLITVRRIAILLVILNEYY